MQIFKGMGLVVLLIGLVAAIVAGFWAIRYYTASTRGQINANEQIQSAPSRIGAYNHFFDLCASIQAEEAQLAALHAELQTAPTDRDRSRVSASITGVRAARMGAIARYNADARKDYTIGQFRDSGLPYQLPAVEWQEGVRTSCGAN